MFNIKEEIAAYESELIALRRDFHENPELGYREYRTSKIVYDYLKKLGLEVTNISITGVVGLLKGEAGPGKTILMRANMDASPVDEKTGCSYSSKIDGIMHASGHDGHLAILMVTAKILSRHKKDIYGNIKFVFQPNEEEAGALDMINEGVLENPDVDAAVAVHLWSPILSGNIGLSAGPILGTTEEFELKIIGRSGHTSTPHTGKDAVLGAAKVIDAVQVLETREFDPLYPITIMFGKLKGGNARNVIADCVETGGTIRFLFPDDKEGKAEVLSRFERIVKGVCSAMDLQYELEFIPSNPSLINDQALVSIMRNACEKTFERTDNIEEFKSLTGEDFAEFSQRVPSVMVFVGINNPEAGSIYPHHHPMFNIDENVLKYAVELEIRTALSFLEKNKL